MLTKFNTLMPFSYIFAFSDCSSDRLKELYLINFECMYHNAFTYYMIQIYFSEQTILLSAYIRRQEDSFGTQTVNVK